jgi:hypothetical protein
MKVKVTPGASPKGQGDERRKHDQAQNPLAFLQAISEPFLLSLSVC